MKKRSPARNFFRRDFQKNPIFWNTGSVQRNAVNTKLMTAAFKLGIQIFIHDFAGHVIVNETSRHDKTVGVIVLTDKVCYLRNPAQTGPDALMLVQGH